MVLVDTPGIKEEDDDDNSQLYTHLRKASALIYIIKTDNAGGTHKVVDINQYINIRIPRNVSSSFLFDQVFMSNGLWKITHFEKIFKVCEI